MSRLASLSEVFCHVDDGKHLGIGRAPHLVFDFSGIPRLLSDDQAMRDTQQVRIGEFHSGSLRTIVQQHVETGVHELRIERVSRFLNTVGFFEIYRNQNDIEWGDSFRPDDSPLIVVLFDGGESSDRCNQAKQA